MPSRSHLNLNLKYHSGGLSVLRDLFLISLPGLLDTSQSPLSLPHALCHSAAPSFFHSSFPLFLTDKEKEECALLSMSFHPAHSFHILLLTLTLSLLRPPAAAV